jgi:argininosuccinate synthase
VAVTIDLGQGKELEEVRDRALGRPLIARKLVEIAAIKQA